MARGSTKRLVLCLVRVLYLHLTQSLIYRSFRPSISTSVPSINSMCLQRRKHSAWRSHAHSHTYSTKSPELYRSRPRPRPRSHQWGPPLAWVASAANSPAAPWPATTHRALKRSSSALRQWSTHSPSRFESERRLWAAGSHCRGVESPIASDQFLRFKSCKTGSISGLRAFSPSPCSGVLSHPARVKLGWSRHSNLRISAPKSQNAQSAGHSRL